MQGGAVYHRATALTAPADRVSLVNAYVSLDVSKPDPTRTFFVSTEGPYSWIEEDAERRHTFADYARHTAWLSREKLTRVLQDLPFDASREDSMSSLRAAAADLQRAIETLEIGPQHFEEMEVLRRRHDRELLG
jgi:hypothetical protein